MASDAFDSSENCQDGFRHLRDREICHGTTGYFRPLFGRGHGLFYWLSARSHSPLVILVPVFNALTIVSTPGGTL